VSNPQKRRARGKNSPETSGSTASQQNLSPARKWTFRFVAALLFPLGLLALGELGLRVSGFGYPTDFFLLKEINGRRVFVGNDKFGWRFFPRELARNPSPLVMSADKPKDACRIFILGESAALGDPEPAYGFGHYLQVLLEQRFPETHFEVICTAMTAINSHAVRSIARECAQHEGDVWVVYMGNNEFVGPFGPSTIFGPQVPPLSLIRLNLALKKTRMGQLLAQFGSESSKRKRWGGMKMFSDHQVAPADPRKEKVYRYFRSNLEDILDEARDAGAKVVLSTVGSNLKDCPPFGSQHSPLSESQMADWQQHYATAIQQQKASAFEAALSNYQAAAELDSSFAELQFRWAQCFLALTNLDQAKRHFELARDFDSLPFRADARLNEVISKTAELRSGQGVAFVDGARILSKQSPGEIAGKEYFYEHVHLNFDGNYRLALAVAESVARLLPTNAVLAKWSSAEQCARTLAVTLWDRRRIDESLLRRLAEPPFLDQMDHAAQMDSLQQTMTNLRSQQTPQALQEARLIYRKATEAAPEDFYLHADFAKLEEDSGNLANAINEWKAVRDLLPFAPGPHYYLGRVLGRAGKTEEALKELDAALFIRPDLPEALEEKGRVLARIKQFDEALKQLERAADLEPENTRLCLQRAQTLAEAGRRPEAISLLQHAVEVQPGSPDAHYLLGVELAFSGEMQSAAEQFLATVRLNPNYAPGHLNLGIALSKLGKEAEAMVQFEETLRLDPKNQKATEYLEALKASQQRKRSE
jgi:tetratricopeptide (TPR) repeat protein